jgi:hypothetical protein
LNGSTAACKGAPMEGLGTILLIIGIWLVLQFIMRKAGVPT